MLNLLMAPKIRRKKPKDFDDSANTLWYLYGKEAKSHDEARMQILSDDMDGLLIFVCIGHDWSVRLTSFSLQAGLFSAVLTSFVVPKFQDLGVNPAQQSVYYQNQSVQILLQISQQIASIGTQIPLNVTQPLPYPIFHPSVSDRRVNVFWLMSLVCSLSASLLATVVQQWTRSYLRVYQRSNPPPEDCAHSNIFVRRSRTHADDGGGRSPAYPRLRFPFLCGACRCRPEYQHNSWCRHRRPYHYLRILLPLQLGCTINGSPIVLPEPILGLDLVYPP